MSRPTVSFTKRQREQSKREKKAEKLAKRAQRKITKAEGGDDDEVMEVLSAPTDDGDAVAAQPPAE